MHQRLKFLLPSTLVVLLTACEPAESNGDPQGQSAGNPTEGEGQPTSDGNLVDFVPLHVDESLDPADDPDLKAATRMSGFAKWRNLGNSKYIPTKQETGPAYEPNGDEAPDRTMVGMVTRRGHYLLEFDRHAMVSPGNPERNPVEGGWTGAAAPFDDSQKGWSRAVDNRNLTTPTPLGIGAIGSCTGALVGERIARTAAHCIIDHNTGGGTVAASRTFTYGKNSAAAGTSTTTSTFFYSASYIGAGCGTKGPAPANDIWAGYSANLSNCTSYDWAYLILNSGWDTGVSVGWFSYSMLSASNLGLAVRHGGYPVCSVSGAPAFCASNGYYQDTSADCKVSSWDAGTWKWHTGCDTSSGHSGGPVWWAGGSWPTHLGHVVWEDCNSIACGSLNTAPNRVLGTDQGLFDTQTNLVTAFP